MKVMILSCALLIAGLAAWAAAPEGKAVYEKSCKSCHGATGQGNPAIAKAMKVELKALGSKEVQGTSDADLKKAITAGTGKMKPVAVLSKQQVDDVVAFMRTLK